MRLEIFSRNFRFSILNAQSISAKQPRPTDSYNFFKFDTVGLFFWYFKNRSLGPSAHKFSSVYFLLGSKEPQHGTQAFFDPHTYLHKAKEKIRCYIYFYSHN